MNDCLEKPSLAAAERIARFRALLGEHGVLSAAEDMVPYLTGPTRRRGEALCVLRPASTAEVAAAVRLARELGLTIVPQGGNTGLSDGAIPLDTETVVLNLLRMNRIREIDADSSTMTVEAGVVLAAAQTAAREADLMLPFSIGSEGSCTIGGNLATNAGGKSALRYGTAATLVIGLEVVLADGNIWNGLRSVRKDNTGMDLKQLFLGSEGRLGIITAAVVALVPLQGQRATAFVAVKSPDAALRLLILTRQRMGDAINAFELLNRFTLSIATKHLSLRPPFQEEPEWSVLMEVSAAAGQEQLSERLLDLLQVASNQGIVDDAVLASNEQQAQEFWRMRDDGATIFWKEGAFLLHDPAVPVSKVPEFIRRVMDGVQAHLPNTRIAAFGHVGDGNIHVIASQPVGMDKKEFVSHRAAFQAIVYGAAIDLGGSFSAEHGIGNIKRKALEAYRDPAHLQLMDKLKTALDPEGVLNPEKVRN